MRIYKPKWKRPDGTSYECPRWYTQFFIGGRLFRRALGTTDKRIAEEKAAAARKREERRLAGLLDPAEEAREIALDKHLEAFEAMLVSRGVSQSHRADRMACLHEFVGETGATRIQHLDEAKATGWLRRCVEERHLSARSTNRRYQALRQFARWAVANRRLSWDPFAALKPLNEAADRRHLRRALSPEELSRLLDAARARPLAERQAERVNKGVTPREQARLLALGRARALCYAVAAGTGLRRGELKRLTWGDLDLARRIVFVPAASAKSRRDQSVPLRSDLAADLAAFRPQDAAPGDLVFPSRVFPTLRTYKRDAVAAGLGTMERRPGAASGCETFDLEDESGRALDFHCLRVTFVSGLVAAGVHPRVAQALARHAKIETTMAVYTDIHSLDLRGAVERLTPERGRRERTAAGG